MVTTVKHAALAYPPPADDVEVVVTRHTVSTRKDLDMLTQELTEWTNVELRAEAKAWGRTDHYRLDSYGSPNLPPTLWHEHGNGSSSSLEHPDTNNALVIIGRHSAEREDPCDRYYAAYVLGSDLTAKVHTRNYNDVTQCGRDMTQATRVLRITVDDDQWCGSCSRAY